MAVSVLNTTASLSGKTLLIAEANLTPGTDAAYDVGTIAFKYRDGYFSRNVSIGGTLAVTGAVTLSSTFAAGATTLSGALSGTTATFSSTVTERGRSFAMGATQLVSYSAGNFNAPGGGANAWTVDAADQETFSYRVVGDTMFLTFSLKNTSVAGPPLSLTINVPSSFTIQEIFNQKILALDNGTSVNATATGAVGGSVVTLTKDDGAVWAAATNTTHIKGSLVFKVS